MDRLLAALAALGTLDQREREIVIDRRLLGRSHKEIAGTLHLSPQRVSQLKQRADRKLAAIKGQG